MVSTPKLEIELQESFKKKEYSKVVFEITSRTTDNERTSSLYNLLGICRIESNKKDKDTLLLAIKDFKQGFLKEKNTIHAIDCLGNFITSSVLLKDIEKDYKFDFSDLINLYESSKEYCLNHRSIHLAMTMIYRRLNHSEKMIFHLDKVIKLKDFNSFDLCNYGYWRCYDKNWKQSDFFNYGKFVDESLKEIPQNQLVKLSEASNSKIRIGFLSADVLGGHSITYFLKSLLLNYDKKKFEIFLILNNPKEDQSTKDFKDLVDETINIWNLNNVSAVNRVRELKLDAMVDLMGYTSMNRIEMLKSRTAKKQFIWMGYCNTTGIKNMDYLISDSNLIFSNEEKFYSEKVIYLPKIWNSHCGFDLERIENPPPFLKNKFFTFGSFNNFDKINSDVISVWSNILKKINNSKLILKTSKIKHGLERLKALFKENGVLDSIKFIGREKEFKDHLNAYNEIDIALDTFPYNGVTTSFEAIWMGVPVLAMAGYNFNSRCGESINKNLGMDEMIARDESDYVQKIVNLSNNHGDYIKLRKFVFANALKSPLFDNQNYSKSFFEALEKIVK